MQPGKLYEIINRCWLVFPTMLIVDSALLLGFNGACTDASDIHNRIAHWRALLVLPCKLSSLFPGDLFVFLGEEARGPDVVVFKILTADGGVGYVMHRTGFRCDPNEMYMSTYRGARL